MLYLSPRRTARAIMLRRRRQRASSDRLTNGEDWITDVSRIASWHGGCILIDVGANTGDVTSNLATRFPEHQILAFEPVELTRQSLAKGVASFGNVQVYGMALSDQNGRALMTNKPNSETNRIVEESSREDVEMVETRTLDAVLSSLGWPEVGFLKIDTEGSDLKVLHGAAEALNRGLIDTVLIECTFNLRRAPHVDVIDVLKVMREKGFDVVSVYSENVGRFTRGSGHSNVLFARQWSG